MDKKVLKFYETPVVEFVNTELEGFLCTSGETNADGITVEDPENGGDE